MGQREWYTRGIVEKLKVDKRTWRLGERGTKRVAKKLKNPLNKKPLKVIN